MFRSQPNAKIKEAAVRKQNILINTMQFLNTKADGDPARKHPAKLNRMAVDCEFKLEAGETDYSKKMVQFQLVHGLEEPDIQEQRTTGRFRSLEESS